jgi:hypothetical protein
MLTKKLNRLSANAISGLAIVALSLAGCGTLIGAGVGAGAGAAVGSATGYGTAKGALIGTGIGAAAGAIYDITKHERDKN